METLKEVTDSMEEYESKCWGQSMKKLRKPTIYEVLANKLGRAPTYNEQVEEVKRILRED